MRRMLTDLPYLGRETNRHGKECIYVRRHGRRIRIHAKEGTAAFATEYHAALAKLASPDKPGTAPNKGTLRWLAVLYFLSAEFHRLDPQSQRTRRGIIEDCLRETRTPTSKDLMADCPLKNLGSQHVRVMRDRKADKPGSANNRLKYLSSMFRWGIEAGHLPFNPARDVKPIRYASDGFHTWSPDEVRQFEERHAIGTKARLALALLLFTGARRGDVVTFGKQHVKDGWLRFVPRKTRHRRATASEKPILPELAEVIAQSPCGDLTFLVTEYGKGFTAAGFGNWFRQRCNEAGLPHCSAHGLRKAGATLAAERGATERQLMALFDWTSPQQATVYTRKADQRKLSGSAAQLLRPESEQPSVAPKHVVSHRPVSR